MGRGTRKVEKHWPITTRFPRSSQNILFSYKQWWILEEANEADASGPSFLEMPWPPLSIVSHLVFALFCWKAYEPL